VASGDRGHAPPGAARTSASLDAVRTGLAAGVGAAAAVGLMLAFRRQYHQEFATQQTDHDATERRVTELYSSAVEELGSDKATVRLAGLYSPERRPAPAPAQWNLVVPTGGDPGNSALSPPLPAPPAGR
jgi:hypothetical protein